MIAFDIPSLAIFLISVLLLVLFYWHSKVVLRSLGYTTAYGEKDADDYVSGKRYNEHVGSLSKDAEDAKQTISSFLWLWRGILFVYVVVISIILYTGYSKNVQIFDRVDNLERRVNALERKFPD